jgi:nucleotide-binding universal stress UspA family protein
VYQFRFDARSWYIAIVWVFVGLFIYLAFFQRKTEALEPKVLDVQPSKAPSPYNFRILIPLHDADHMAPLMNLAAPIAKANQGEIIALGVVDVPINLPTHEGLRFVHHRTPVLKQAVEYGKQLKVETRSAVRIAHRVYDGIIHAAEAERASLMVIGWKGYTSTRDRIMGEVTDKVVRHTPCDLIAVSLTGDKELKRILVPTAGGPHANLAAEYVGLYRDVLDCEVTCCYVVKPDASERERATAEEWIRKTVHLTGLEGKVKVRLIEGRRVATALVKAGADYDLIVIGASNEGVFSSVLLGEIPEKVAKYSRTPVMVVKRYEGVVKSLVKKVMG